MGDAQCLNLDLPAYRMTLTTPSLALRASHAPPFIVPFRVPTVSADNSPIATDLW